VSDRTGPPERTPETRLREQRILEDGETFFGDVGSAPAGFLVE
jgi:hypothetical protein